jgi:hypothetical protein
MASPIPTKTRARKWAVTKGGDRLSALHRLLVGDARTIEALPDDDPRRRPTFAARPLPPARGGGVMTGFIPIKVRRTRGGTRHSPRRLLARHRRFHGIPHEQTAARAEHEPTPQPRQDYREVLRALRERMEQRS